MIFRDSRYWAPLILMTMGTRLTEVLQLKRGDIISRDFTLCLSLRRSAMAFIVNDGPWGTECGGAVHSASKVRKNLNRKRQARRMAGASPADAA